MNTRPTFSSTLVFLGSKKALFAEHKPHIVSMTEETRRDVAADSLSLNIVSESMSRALLIVAGITSSALLVRATDVSWSISDYAHLKVLMYWSNVVILFILMGLTTAVVKSVSENAHRKAEVGTVIGTALISVTLSYLIMAFATVVLANQIGFLVGESPTVTAELRLLWILVVLSMLPSAYLQITKSVISGFQRMKRTVGVDIVYNSSRICVLVVLYVNNMITITNVLYMYLGTMFLGFAAGAAVLQRELKAEGISIQTRGWRRISRSMFAVSGAIFGLALISSFGNYIIPLLVDYYGTDFDMARYSIALATLTTVKSFIYAPFAVLFPNLAGMSGRGEYDMIRTRFDESNRIMLPTFIFAFIVVLTFGDAILGTIYGVRGLDTTGGLSAAQFLFAISPTLLIWPINGLYTNLVTALGRMKALVGMGLLSVSLQVIWIVLLQPHYGVVALAYVWLIGIPMFFLYHYYCKKSVSVAMSTRFLTRSIILVALFLGVAWGVSLLGELVVNALSFIPLLQLTTFSSLAKLVFIIPLWYLFIAFCLGTRVMNFSDVNNLRKFLRRIPPVWWISRPLLDLVERTGKKYYDKLLK